MLPQVFHYTLFADYFQIYMLDAEAQLDFSNAWNDETIANHLATIPGGVAIGTARNYLVPITVEILDKKPAPDAGKWDIINECSITVSSGNLVIMGCTEDFNTAARIALEPSTYRIRAFYGGLDTVSSNRLEGSDQYKLILWCDEPIAPRVVKKK